MLSDTPFISLEALKIKRGGRLLAHGIQMCVKSGMVVWLKGTNGAGKTTLLETLAGLLPGAGDDTRQTCYIPAAPMAWQPFCVGELVRHWQALYPGAAPDAAHLLAALVDRTLKGYHRVNSSGWRYKSCSIKPRRCGFWMSRLRVLMPLRLSSSAAPYAFMRRMAARWCSPVIKKLIVQRCNLI